MNHKILSKTFFSRNPKIVAKDLIGKVIERKIGKNILKAIIIETEAYFDENDPASWARYGKRKDNIEMWNEAGTILVKNVHKHLMLNFVTGKEGEASAVLIRGVKPINFDGRTHGPGLLTSALKIDKGFNGKSILDHKEIKIVDDGFRFKDEEIKTSKRIGVKKDLDTENRFYVKL
ncbi:hypothetical protein COU57_06490 [Candidatus Pacearchaeota archaeon CG10_big_fil_rev_8_21_14_0_10_32_14]|nr:MAG: hypothetical protein COU57_06490 [Candidatus Pacearchaeota archaeon CG10_big_fil_rev_8_21_14_0_10_32_14]